jgi:hypothetical protein
MASTFPFGWPMVLPIDALVICGALICEGFPSGTSRVKNFASSVNTKRPPYDLSIDFELRGIGNCNAYIAEETQGGQDAGCCCCFWVTR